MSEVSNKKYAELFKAGQTRESFLTKFKELFTKTDSLNEISVFNDVSDDETITAIFDVMTSAVDDGDIGDSLTLSKKDIDKIASYDGDNSSVSDEDIVKYYKEKLDDYKKELDKNVVTDDAEISPMEGETAKPSITTAKGIDLLFSIKQLDFLSAAARKSQILNEISDLIKNADEKKQKKAEKILNKIKNIEKSITEKELALNNNDNKLKQLEVTIARKQSELDNSKDENNKSNLSDEIKDLNKQYNLTSSKSEKLKNNLAKLNSEKRELVNTLNKTMNDTGVASLIETKNNELRQIDFDITNYMSGIDSRISGYQSQLLTTAQTNGAQCAYYSNVANGVINDGHVGKTAAQALNNAIGEIGTREATGHNDGAAVAKYRGGVDNGAAWCASFVSWCYKGNDVFGYQASVSGIRAKAQEKGLYSTINSGYVPKPGDVMIQKENGASHTGIVESVDPDGTIHTIEGNASNMVRRVTYRVGSKGYNQISGFVRMSDGQ